MIILIKSKKLHQFQLPNLLILSSLHLSYFEKYLNSDYRCKYLLFILKNRSLELADVLYDDYAIVYLLEVLKRP